MKIDNKTYFSPKRWKEDYHDGVIKYLSIKKGHKVYSKRLGPSLIFKDAEYLWINTTQTRKDGPASICDNIPMWYHHSTFGAMSEEKYWNC